MRCTVPELFARRRPLVALVALGLLAGCQQGAGGGGFPGVSQETGEVSPILGTLGGAGAGALAGRLIAGGHDNSAAMLGGALIGGLGGLLGTSYYNKEKQTQASQQEQLSYTQSQLAQQQAMNQQLESQRIYEQWGNSRGYGPPPPTMDQVTSAQRLLTALGYYNGPIDGISGPRTGAAVSTFQQRQGLQPTGYITPVLLQQLRAAV